MTGVRVRGCEIGPLVIPKGTCGNLLKLPLFEERRFPAGPKLGLRPDSPGASVCYLHEGQTRPTPIPLATTVTGRFLPGGFAEVDAESMPGLYEFCPPDEVFACGYDSALVMLQFPSTRPCLIYIALVDYDPYDGVGLGLNGFTSGVRHEHLTGIFRRVFPPIIAQLTGRSG